MQVIGKKSQYSVTFPDGTILYLQHHELEKSEDGSVIASRYRQCIEKHYPQFLDKYDQLRQQNEETWRLLDEQLQKSLTNQGDDSPAMALVPASRVEFLTQTANAI